MHTIVLIGLILASMIGQHSAGAFPTDSTLHDASDPSKLTTEVFVAIDNNALPASSLALNGDGDQDWVDCDEEEEEGEGSHTHDDGTSSSNANTDDSEPLFEYVNQSY
ncbi:hypothetical protein HDU97_008548 [Phlyctochytrium planicorne]|nr:hypothetical protein HDU97_008548 [Phlyctochytrium planicorne]